MGLPKLTGLWPFCLGSHIRAPTQSCQAFLFSVKIAQEFMRHPGHVFYIFPCLVVELHF